MLKNVKSGKNKKRKNVLTSMILFVICLKLQGCING